MFSQNNNPMQVSLWDHYVELVDYKRKFPNMTKKQMEGIMANNGLLWQNHSGVDNRDMFMQIAKNYKYSESYR